MKYVLPLLLLVACSTAYSQDYQQLAKKTCECAAEKNLAGQTQKQVQVALGLCMLEAAKAENFDIDLSDPDAARGLGEKVGVQMATECPEVFSAFTKQMTEESDEAEEFEVQGKIKSVELGNFAFVVLKEEAGKEGKYLWLRYFQGSDDFLTDPKKLVGRKVKIRFKNIECFLPKASGYFMQKEITGIEIN